MDFPREPCRMVVSDDKGPMLVSSDMTEIEGFLKGVDAFCH